MNRLAACLLALALFLPSSAAAQVSPEAGADRGAHTVAQGHTLWDLADLFYGDPYLWPRIWDANRDRIPDPNLIHPGQLIRIPGEDGSVREVRVVPIEPGSEPDAVEPVVVVERVASARTELADARAVREVRVRSLAEARELARVGERAAEPMRVRRRVVTRSPAGVPADYQAGAPFLVPEGTRAPELARIGGFTGAEEIRTRRPSARPFDRLVLDATEALRPGTVLQAYRLDRWIPGLGYVAVPTAVLSVIDSEGPEPVAEVVALYGRAVRGDFLRAVPAADASAGGSGASSGMEARVIAVAAEHPLQSIGDHLFVDLGAGTLSVGDELEPVWSPAGAQPEGRATVVAVQDDFATLRIMALTNPVFEAGLSLRVVSRAQDR